MALNRTILCFSTSRFIFVYVGIVPDVAHQVDTYRVFYGSGTQIGEVHGSIHLKPKET